MAKRAGSGGRGWKLVPIALLVLLSGWEAASAVPPSSVRSCEAIARVRPELEWALREAGLRWGDPIFIRIFKESGELEIWLRRGSTFELFRTYAVCAASGDLGPKRAVGDLQSPEGFYFVTAGRMNPWSRFHLSFDLGYPNAYDRHHGRSGSELMVHGSCVSLGCYAVTDAAIEEIFALADAALRNGQSFFRVHVFPFRMDDDAMHLHRHWRWIGFWRNLKEGYDAFESTRRPPDVVVRNGVYVFRVLPQSAGAPDLVTKGSEPLHRSRTGSEPLDMRTRQ